MVGVGLENDALVVAAGESEGDWYDMPSLKAFMSMKVSTASESVMPPCEELGLWFEGALDMLLLP